MTPNSVTRTSIWRLVVEVSLVLLCGLYFLFSGRAPFGSSMDVVIALIALAAFLVIAWERYSQIVRRHDLDSSFRRDLNRIESYSIRPEAAAGEGRIDQIEQEIRQASGSSATPSSRSR